MSTSSSSSITSTTPNPTLNPSEQPTTNSQPIDGVALLEDVSAFFARYLQCSDHQRAVLALWVLHTYCFYTSHVTPYLAIQSTQKQCGKTLCLQLLQMLCDESALTCGITLRNLALRQKLNPNSAIFLDEFQATIGTRSRPKAPALRAFLASSFHTRVGYSVAAEERDVWCPKAFAGKGQLPEELADRSIPIILKPLENCVAQPPSAVGARIHRFNLHRALQQAEPIAERLEAWSQEYLPPSKDAPPYSDADFPPNLSPRRQDMIEPLLKIADQVGGQWPARVRQAVVAIFEEAANFDLQPNLALLGELYNCFYHYGFPMRLTTAIMLQWLQSRSNCLWEAEGAINAHRLARFLHAFEIHPRAQRLKKDAKEGKDSNDDNLVLRGYELMDFLEPWRRQLELRVPGLTRKCPPEMSAMLANYHPSSPSQTMNRGVSAFRNSQASSGPLGKREPAVAGESVPPKSETANECAACSTVALDQTCSNENAAERPALAGRRVAVAADTVALAHTFPAAEPNGSSIPNPADLSPMVAGSSLSPVARLPRLAAGDPSPMVSYTVAPDPNQNDNPARSSLSPVPSNLSPIFEDPAEEFSRTLRAGAARIARQKLGYEENEFNADPAKDEKWIELLTIRTELARREEEAQKSQISNSRAARKARHNQKSSLNGGSV